MVERLQVQSDLAAELLQAQLGEDAVPAAGKVGAVVLKLDARLDDCEVVLAHGVSNCGEVGLAVGIVAVGQGHCDHAGRGGGHEEPPSPRRFGSCAQPLKIAVDTISIAPAHLSRAGGHPRSKGAAPLLEALQHVMVVQQVARQLGSEIFLVLETGQPLVDVGRVADPALLAVVDHVDTCLDLEPHDLGHRPPKTVLQTDWVAASLVLGELGNQVGPARQAAGVCGQDPAHHPLIVPRSKSCCV